LEISISNNLKSIWKYRSSTEPDEDVIEFAPMKIWRVGEENIIEYFLPVKFDEAAADWIGVYKVSF
jgi:hypothetical protein